jgi:penicillin-binding protein 1A
MGRSINSVAAQITKAIKVNAIVQMARDCGITSPLEEVPALCLGSSDVSVFEQVKGYSTFVNEGHQTEPLMILRIEDKKGNVLKEFHPVSKQTITPQTAYTMTYMLGGAINEAGGTAEGLKRYAFAQGNEGIGAKTGTTSNYSDGWFMGITPQLAVGVWVGGDNRSIHFRTISLGQGAKMAMPAFGMFMDKCFGDNTLSFAKIPFPKPHSVTSQYNCVGAADSTSVQSSTEQPKDEDGGLFK